MVQGQGQSLVPPYTRGSVSLSLSLGKHRYMIWVNDVASTSTQPPYDMAFIVLLFSTMDLVMGVLSTLTIAGIVVTVMGVGVRGIMGQGLMDGAYHVIKRILNPRLDPSSLQYAGFGISPR